MTRTVQPSRRIFMEANGAGGGDIKVQQRHLVMQSESVESEERVWRDG